MSQHKPGPAKSQPTRERVLAAAERLLAEGRAEFSMRELAAEAGVSFATPFNQFGNKLSIMRALSAERIECMHREADLTTLPVDAADRVLAVVAIAAGVMMEKSTVNRAVMGAIGAPGLADGDTRDRSRALWAAALGDGVGLAPDYQAVAAAVLPDQLAIAFRGVLSFWTAGEIEEADLRQEAVAAAATLLFGFVDPARKSRLVDSMNGAAS